MKLFGGNDFRNMVNTQSAPGDTQDESALEEHRQHFVRGLVNILPQLQGPVLDFVVALEDGSLISPSLYGSRPFTGTFGFCRNKYQNEVQAEFHRSSDLASLLRKVSKPFLPVRFFSTIVEKICAKNSKAIQ